MTDHNYTVVILAGGQSTRFKESTGMNKLYYQIDGRSLLQRSVDLAEQVGDQVIISVNSEVRKREVQNQITQDNIKIIIDDPDITINGPLKGLLSVFKSIKSTTVVIAADYPFLRGDTLKQLLDTHGRFDCDLSIFSSASGQLHNLLFVVEPERIKTISSVLEKLKTSRVSNLIRSMATICILKLQKPSGDLVNMNKLYSTTPNYSDLMFDTIVLSTHDIFIRYCDKQFNDGSKYELKALLSEELEIWKNYSIGYIIQQDLERL